MIMLRRSLATALLALVTFGATVPRPAGEFAFETPNGQHVLLSKYRGKVVLLAFFSTTCPHCQNAARMMERLQKEYGPKGFQALGVCFNDMAKMLTAEFIQNQQITFPVGYALQEQVLPYVQHPQGAVPYVPMFVFIDRQGVVRYQATGGDEPAKIEEPNVRTQLLKILNGAPAAAPAQKKAPGKS